MVPVSFTNHCRRATKINKKSSFFFMTQWILLDMRIMSRSNLAMECLVLWQQSCLLPIMSIDHKLFDPSYSVPFSLTCLFYWLWLVLIIPHIHHQLTWQKHVQSLISHGIVRKALSLGPCVIVTSFLVMNIGSNEQCK